MDNMFPDYTTSASFAVHTLLQVFVFDFGSEMYVWTGKHVPFDRRKRALRLAIELWDAGYDFTGYDINPLCPLIGTKLRTFSRS